MVHVKLSFFKQTWHLKTLALVVEPFQQLRDQSKRKIVSFMNLLYKKCIQTLFRHLQLQGFQILHIEPSG